MAALFHYIFNDALRIVSGETPILLTLPSHITKSARESVYRILFDGFKIPGIYAVNPAVLAA